MRIQIANPAAHPGFVRLPWERPLEEWPDRVLAGKPGGLHRHVVRYIRRNNSLYALKELPTPLAEREYRLLRALAGHGLPCVEVVGVVSDRGDDTAGQGVLISRYLDFSLPYRVLLVERRMPYLAERVLDALAGLLVRLHLVGFWWGDCSLSNTLFRRDAGALAAYVVDVETGELHEGLSEGQRELDLGIAVENIAGGVADLQAAGHLDPDIDVVEVVERIERGYTSLWDELTKPAEVDTEESLGMSSRLQRLNELGFDVEELEITRSPEGESVRITPRVVELGFYSRQLAALTGLHAAENQARRLLNDIKEFGARMERRPGRVYPEALIAARWLDQVFEPAIARIPPALSDKLELAELYHQLLEHRWFLSERAGRDVGIDVAARSYVESVLQYAPDERTVEVEGLA